jgi:hypothetical protein
MNTPNADAWELAGFPGRLNVAAYLTADQLAAQYRVLVDVLLDAQEQSLTGVGRDDLLMAVRERIAAATDLHTADWLTDPEVFDLDKRMQALQQWGVVIRWQDKAKTEADFIRTRDRFQLTSEAADLHRWLRRKIDEDAVATSAAAFAPAIIAERVEEAVAALEARDHARAAQAWAQVRTTLKDMADAASIWQSRMASALAGAPDEGKMRRLRETLMAYVMVWGAGVDSYSPRIRAGLRRLSAEATDADWRAMALTGLDPAATEETVQAIALGNADATEILAVWFGESRGQALRLRRQVRDAVTPLLRGSRALLATGGRVTRRAELLRIASAMESAASDDEAWRVWCAATGLWSARHLPGTPDEPAEAPARTSFWAAPAVPSLSRYASAVVSQSRAAPLRCPTAAMRGGLHGKKPPDSATPPTPLTGHSPLVPAPTSQTGTSSPPNRRQSPFGTYLPPPFAPRLTSWGPVPRSPRTTGGRWSPTPHHPIGPQPFLPSPKDTSRARTGRSR